MGGAACTEGVQRASTAALAAVTVVYTVFVLSELGAGRVAIALLAPFLLLVALFGLTTRFPSGGLRVLAPLVAWGLGYDAAVRAVQVAPDRYVDPWLAAVDRALLDALPVSLAGPLGGPLEELANLLYVSYYAVVPLGLLWVWHRHGEPAAVRYGLAVVVTVAACAVWWIAVPAGGLHPTGGPVTEPFGPFTAVARAVYAANPHHAAAFPSSHVAVAVAVAVLITRLGGSRAWLLWSLGVAWATFQGQYHYLVDSPPAILMGWGAARFALTTAGLPGYRPVVPLASATEPEG